MSLGLSIGSVFSGIGGLDLGLERAGVGHVRWFCESDPFARRVLGKHWPGVPIFPDIRAMGDDTPPVDVVAGGFPCQDISKAGKGAGIHGERSGLFFELARIAVLVGCRIIVLENVPAITARGLGVVLGQLASMGFDAEWRCISGNDVGSPQRRLRWFCVAHATEERTQGGIDPGNPRRQSQIPTADRGPSVGHANGLGSRTAPRISPGARSAPESHLGGDSPGVPDGLDGHRWPMRPGPQQHEWEPPRTIERGPNHTARLRCLGNAVIPQVAEVVGRWVVELDEQFNARGVR